MSVKFITRNLYTIIAIGALIASVFFFFQMRNAYKSEQQDIKSTSVGHFYVGNLQTDAKIITYLESQIPTWKATTSYKLYFQDVEYELKGLGIADFNASKTVKNISNNTKNNAVFDVNSTEKTDLYLDLVDAYGQEFVTDLDFEALVTDIIDSANNLRTRNEFSLYDYLPSSWTMTSITSATLSNLTKNEIDSCLKIIKEVYNDTKYHSLDDSYYKPLISFDSTIVIAPQEETTNKLGFSFIEYFEKYYKNFVATKDQAEIYQLSDYFNIIATGMAASIQCSSFHVTVKEQSLKDVNYAYNYMTVGVSFGNNGSDFRFINPEANAYYIGVRQDSSSSLVFELIGCKYLNKYVVTPEIEDIVLDPTYVRDSSLEFLGEDGKMLPNVNVLIDPNSDDDIYYVITDPGETGKLVLFNRKILSKSISSYVNESGETVAYPTYLDADGITYYLIGEELVYSKHEYYKATAATWTFNLLDEELYNTLMEDE